MKKLIILVVSAILLAVIGCTPKNNISGIALRTTEGLLGGISMTVTFTAARSFEHVYALEYELSNDTIVVAKGNRRVKEDNPYWVKGNEYDVVLTPEAGEWDSQYSLDLLKKLFKSGSNDFSYKNITKDENMKLKIWLDGELFYTFYLKDLKPVE